MDAEASIGIVGGGQLAWMLAEAARAGGVALHVQTPSAQDPAAALATSVVQADVRDVAGTAELARRCSAISFENEWVDLDGLAALASTGVTFVPSLQALRPLVCKRSQRELLQRLNLPSPRWFPLEQVKAELADRQAAAARQRGDGYGDGRSGDAAAHSDAAGRSGSAGSAGGAAPLDRHTLLDGFRYPVMAKAASGGYDGRGTAVLEGDDDLEDLLARVDPATWIVEEFVEFEQELAVVAARDSQGEVVIFPLVQTHQHEQVCDWVLAPVQASHALEQAVRNIAASLLTSLHYVGVLAIEFFYGRRGLLINELAPRTHNSGHYSIEACNVSQFELQLRVVAGQTALEPDLVVPGALMVNLLGFEERDAADPLADYASQREALAALPDAHLHWYGKAGSSPGRKLGHITLLLRQAEPAARRQEAIDRLAQVRQHWPLPPEERRSADRRTGQRRGPLQGA
ncbi:MAG: 5-(carboxyamino)imidazole ribonucleotide synthase [Vulcanococcus sp.]